MMTTASKEVPVDVTAIVSVASSGTVAVATLGINALTKRGDRKHETALDYERRVWDDKRAALVAVIGDCNRIRSACGYPEEGYSTKVSRQVAVYQMFDQVRNDLSNHVGPLVAYADKSVWEPLEQLMRIVESTYGWDEFRFALRDIARYRDEKESAIDNQDFAGAAELRDKEKAAQAKVDKGTTLDVEALRKLVILIIDAARKDLSGQ